MRTLIIEFLLLLIALLSQSSAQNLPSVPEPDKDPFVGTWKANAYKSWPKLDENEALYVRTISRDGDDVVFFSRTKRPVSAGFSEKHYRIRCDGLSHRVPCGEASCAKSCTYKAANRVEGEWAGPDGKNYWTEKVSSDGLEMKIYAYRDKTKKKLYRTEVLDRAK